VTRSTVEPCVLFVLEENELQHRVRVPVSEFRVLNVLHWMSGRRVAVFSFTYFLN
jgi:hypothetical protein